MSFEIYLEHFQVRINIIIYLLTLCTFRNGHWQWTKMTELEERGQNLIVIYICCFLIVLYYILCKIMLNKTSIHKSSSSSEILKGKPLYLNYFFQASFGWFISIFRSDKKGLKIKHTNLYFICVSPPLDS